ncbi:hypothetical protein CDD82_5976 [Ophiocordyceps australis]|uniref:Glutamate decarboxylase n=1 Tax=Ophiocordyceps australis TaxID=1399860 RepID=A0A2C5YY62_9HYPO|nr:hypothetical protein CDD82_5976 [Ophiocordyceps australis]
MVHLSKVEKPAGSDSQSSTTQGSTTQGSTTQGVAKAASSMDEFTTSVYGSRFASEDLPRDKMPEHQMPREVAYRMIKDELSLDNNPMLNLASFVTTYMEDEAEKLMTESLSKNFIDYEEYPQTADMQSRCVNMIGDLFHAPGDSAVGTSSVGSSEAIMLAVLAMKRRWRQQRAAAGKAFDKPNLIMSSAVQVCWEKATRYFEIEERFVYCTPSRFVIDAKQVADSCDENTIGCVCILGTTYTGHYEDVKAVGAELDARGLDVVIHVDAASGGFVAPFVKPELEWDFRCSRVVSINVSGHKYGLVYPGVGWVIWRAAEYLPQDLVFNIDYLGAQQSSFTLNFSKGASQVIGQYYQLIRLGRHGYQSIMSNLTHTADYLAAKLQEIGFVIMSEREGRGLPLVAFRLPGPKDDDDDDDAKTSNDDDAKTSNATTSKKDGGDNKTSNDSSPQNVHLAPSSDRHFDEFALAHTLRARGWVVPAYTMAPNTNRLKMLRVVVREDFSRSRCDMLIQDFKSCIALLQQSDRETVQRWNSYIKTHVTSGGRAHNARHKLHSYQHERHSLQGKTGKTHAPC